MASVCLYGGTSKGPQISSLKSGVVSYQVLPFLWMVCIQMPVAVSCWSTSISREFFLSFLQTIKWIFNITFSIQDIVIGTPGRIQDLIEMGICCLKEVSFVVSSKFPGRILFLLSLVFSCSLLSRNTLFLIIYFICWTHWWTTNLCPYVPLF